MGISEQQPEAWCSSLGIVDYLVRPESTSLRIKAGPTSTYPELPMIGYLAFLHANPFIGSLGDIWQPMQLRALAMQDM